MNIMRYILSVLTNHTLFITYSLLFATIYSTSMLTYVYKCVTLLIYVYIYVSTCVYIYIIYMYASVYIHVYICVCHNTMYFNSILLVLL